MKLFKYQKDIVDWALQIRKGAIFVDMGLGKTVIAIDIINKLNDIKPITTLIICPKNALSSWQEHLKKMTSNKLLIELIHGQQKNVEMLLKMKRLPHVILTTYSQIHNIWDFVAKLKYNAVIFDESHYLRNNSQRTKIALKLVSFKEYIFIMTGTPTGNNKYLDYYYQFRLLGVIKYSLSKFKSRYCIYERHQNYVQNRTWWKLIGFQNTDELNNILNTCTVRLLRQSVSEIKRLLLPTPKYYAIYKKQRLFPDSIKPIMVSETASKLYYHLRLMSSGLGERVTKTPLVFSYEKINWLTKFIDSHLNTRIVIWYVHNIEAAILRQLILMLGRPLSHISGKVKEKDNWAHENAICLAQYQSASIGTNELVTSNHAVYFTPPTSVIDWRQAHKRIDRLGQVKIPKHFELCSKKTLEAAIYKAIDAGVSFGIKDFDVYIKKENNYENVL